MIIDATFGLKGRYKAVVLGPDMEVRRESAWSDNVVTNLGVQMLLGGATVAPSNVAVNLQCSCGSGNSTPSVNDTQIQSFIAGTSSTISNSTVRNSTVAPYYVMHTWTWRFPAGAAQGNVAELCVVNNNSTPNASRPVFSRALVRDAGGNPTVITVGPDEYLDVTYELYLYPPSSDQTGTFSQIIDGSPESFSFVSRASNMQATGSPGNSSGWASNNASQLPTIFGIAPAGSFFSGVYVGGDLGGVGGSPTGTLVETNRFGSSTTATGVYASKYRDITYTAGLTESNTTFSCIRLAYNLGCVQMKFDPPITKVNTKTYSITIRVTLDNTI